MRRGSGIGGRPDVRLAHRLRKEHGEPVRRQRRAVDVILRLLVQHAGDLPHLGEPDLVLDDALAADPVAEGLDLGVEFSGHPACPFLMSAAGSSRLPPVFAHSASCFDRLNMRLSVCCGLASSRA